jgi:hypothetical protein
MNEVTDIGVKPPVGPRYIGDGVYASFDGYQIWLHLNAHTAPPLIALESECIVALIEYAETVELI